MSTILVAPVPPPQKGRVRRLIITVVLVSLGIHIVAGLIAGAVIVARYLAEPPAEFKATRDVRLPAKQREHRMNMAAFDGLTPKPSFNDKMLSTRPTAFALPELPKMPLDQMLPLDPSAIVSDQVSSLVGSSGLASGMGDGGAGGGSNLGGTGFSFLGIQSTGKRILLIFDVSTSVMNKASKSGVPISKIKEETLALLKQLPISARFGLIQFTQNYKAFKTELLPATDPNREAARQWIQSEWVETGMMAASRKVTSNSKGLVGVLELAAKMQPDVIFLISDGSFQWREDGSPGTIPWSEVKKVAKGSLQGAGGCKINFIGFEMKPEDRTEAGSIVRPTGGKLREIK